MLTRAPIMPCSLGASDRTQWGRAVGVIECQANCNPPRLHHRRQLWVHPSSTTVAWPRDSPLSASSSGSKGLLQTPTTSATPSSHVGHHMALERARHLVLSRGVGTLCYGVCAGVVGVAGVVEGSTSHRSSLTRVGESRGPTRFSCLMQILGLCLESTWSKGRAPSGKCELLKDTMLPVY